MTQKIPCKYAIVRFRPYVETEEFANVGVVLMSPSARYFGFKLLKGRHARITRFFHELEAKTFKISMSLLEDELSRVSSMLNSDAFDKRKSFGVEHNNQAEGLFHEIVRARETAIVFSDVRVTLAETPNGKMEALFAYYVDRNFITKTFRETALENNLRASLRKNNILRCYERKSLGSQEYSVSFPFVETKVESPRLLKPLNLGQESATKILEHSNSWQFRIEELKERGLIDANKVLFATEGPTDGKRNQAYIRSQMMLEETGAHVIPLAEVNRVIEFARL